MIFNNFGMVVHVVRHNSTGAFDFGAAADVNKPVAMTRKIDVQSVATEIYEVRRQMALKT